MACRGRSSPCETSTATGAKSKHATLKRRGTRAPGTGERFPPSVAGAALLRQAQGAFVCMRIHASPNAGFEPPPREPSQRSAPRGRGTYII
eukprot:scaffold865_cov312-Prasinococcus_capsulatus_cf.AAC.2